MNLPPAPSTPHLSHPQICDLLLADQPAGQAGALSPAAAGTTPDINRDAIQRHLQHCLLCTAELDLLRNSVAAFQSASSDLARRELATRPLRPPFAALTPSRYRAYSVPTLLWATATLLLAAALPFSLAHNPFLGPKPAPTASSSTPATASTSSSSLQSDSDAALLEAINSDLSASVPSALQPLATTSTSTNQGSN